MKNLLFIIVFLAAALTWAENIDPYNLDEQYGWGENVGWLNFEPSQGPGVQVEGDKLTGFVWGENIGWVNLSCENNDTCGTVNYGVVNDGAGNLSGFAWAENVGWINFDPYVPMETRLNEYCVRIDNNGRLSGWAWGENIGWIHFDETQSWDVRACIVTLEDLENFASYWLSTNPAANLDESIDGNVDMSDFSIFSAYWQDFCPDGWQLK